MSIPMKSWSDNLQGRAATDFRLLSLLDSDLQNELRTFYHVTSWHTASRIIKSGCIWSRDLDQFANFSLEEICRDVVAEKPEVVLKFRYDGEGRLIAGSGYENYEKNILYYHVMNGLYNERLENARVWGPRWPVGSTDGLLLVGLKLLDELCEEGTRANAAKAATSLEHAPVRMRNPPRPL